MHVGSVQVVPVVALIVLAYLFYLACLTIYRVFFHPLAGFPGPKHTAATYLVEHYYELFHGEGGQFSRAYRQWHKKYGRIIRINPDELHVQDAAWFESLYSASRPTRKTRNFGYKFQNELSTFGAEDPHDHKVKRSAMNPFFSRKRVALETPAVRRVARAMMSRVEHEYAQTGAVLPISSMWECFAAENVVNFTFGRSFDFIDCPNFHSPVNEGVSKMVEASHWLSFYPIAKLARSLPESVLRALSPNMQPVLDFWQQQESLIRDVLDGHARGDKLPDSVLTTLLQDPNINDVSLASLHQEAKSVNGAGSETTSRALTVATFHILDRPSVRSTLVSELQSAIPDANAEVTWDELAQLPYLSACVDEALRLSYGVIERRARAYDGGPLTYTDSDTGQSWTIPRGTFVSMDNYDVSHDEQIFPESYSFVPERWLGSPRAPDGRQLSRYMASFGKGRRDCLGKQLAYLELSLGLAAFFRAPCVRRLRLGDCSKRDVMMTRDCFVPRAPKDSTGVKAVFEAET